MVLKLVVLTFIFRFLNHNFIEKNQSQNPFCKISSFMLVRSPCKVGGLTRFRPVRYKTKPV